MNVRGAQPADIPQLLTLVRRYWEFEAIEGFHALRVELTLKQLLAEPRWGAAWVADDHGVLRGYLIAVRVLSLEHGGVMAEVDELYVLPQARGRGLGAQLLAAAEAALGASGCVRLQLQLGVANEAARSFYARNGYSARDGYRLFDKALPGPK